MDKTQVISSNHSPQMVNQELRESRGDPNWAIMKVPSIRLGGGDVAKPKLLMIEPADPRFAIERPANIGVIGNNQPSLTVPINI